MTFYGWYAADLVAGHQLQLLNQDQSRTFATVNMHGTRLYILEGTVPRGAPAPGLFQQSLMFLDKSGQQHPLSELLLADVLGRMEVPRAAATAREVIV